MKAQAHRWPPARARLDELIAEAILDANGEAEERGGFYTMIEEHLTLPFVTEVFGVTVIVERVDLRASDEIMAICRRGKIRQAIAIVDLPLPSPPPTGTEWIEAYREWALRG